MHILLLILQIILWIVLGLLALITLLLLIVLLVPIHYSADAVIHDDYTTVAAKVRFLIVSVKVKFDKGTKKLDTAIKILGIRLGGRDTKKVKVKKSKNKKNKKNDEVLVENTPEDIKEDEIQAEDIYVSETQKDTVTDNIIGITKTVQEGMEKIESDEEADYFADESDIETKDDLSDETDIKLKETKKKDKKKREKKNKKNEKKIKPSNNLNSGKNKLDAVNEKIEAVKTKYARFMKFWKMNCTVKTRKYLKKYFPTLLKHVGPRKIKGHVRYGFDEPATTGQITGYLSLLPFMYQKNFFPEPDFYNKVIEGEVSIRGRLQLGYIIRPAFKLHLWKTIKMARKI